jgi:hypothetical protein
VIPRAALLIAAGLFLLPGSLHAQTADEVRVTDAAGRVLVRMETQRPAFRLRDGGGAALGEVRIDDDRVKLRDAGGVERWKIKRKEYGAEIESGTGQHLYRLRRHGQDWRVEDAASAVVVRVKARDGARAWLVLEHFSPVERAALWAYFSTVGR